LVLCQFAACQFAGRHYYYYPFGLSGSGQYTTIMAYYTPQAGQHPAASGAYPYNTYSYTHPQTPGAYPYTTGAYPGTAITGYGAAWPYSYSYYQHQPSSLSKPAASQATTSLPTNAQRTTTFTAYNPTYSRDSAGTAVASGPSARAYKKQSNLKGLFTKERASPYPHRLAQLTLTIQTLILSS